MKKDNIVVLLVRCFPLNMLESARAFAYESNMEEEGKILSAVCAKKKKASDPKGADSVAMETDSGNANGVSFPSPSSAVADDVEAGKVLEITEADVNAVHAPKVATKPI